MRLKIAYLSGPADGPRSFREWSEASLQGYFGTDYMKQFLRFASELDSETYVITWHDGEAYSAQLGNFTFENRPLPSYAGAAFYFLTQAWWSLKTAFRIALFKPDLLVLTGNQNFWWVFAPLRLLACEFLPSFHSVLWPKLHKQKRSWTVLRALNHFFILKRCKAFVAASEDIARQIAELTGSSGNIYVHLPSYTPDQFASIRPPEHSSPFRVIFMGRVEANKGVYLILEVAKRLQADRPGAFTFDICGSGSELDALRARIHEAGLEGVIACHGFCERNRLQELLSQSHVSIVPTRADLEAGFEMTCAESILAGRPLITSAVCPALEYLREASVEVAPDDVDQYLDAIVRLRDDRTLYESKREACGALQHQFFDPANSWLVAMHNAVKSYGFRRANLRVAESEVRA